MNIKKRSGPSNSSISNPISTTKAQVTVFIIVGIVILFVFAGVLYLTQRVSTSELTTESEQALQDVPTEFQPLLTFTQNCLGQTGERALIILGEQGGYIYPDLLGEYSLSDATESDGLNLDPLKVPYWHYNKNPNSELEVQFASLQPQLYAKDDSELSIESQLGRFVKEKLDSCLNDYSAFTAQGYKIETRLAEKKVTVNIADEAVIFNLKMEVTAEKGDNQHDFDQFYVRVPLQLKHYYETADLIASSQRDYSFLERQGLELLSIYSRREAEALPPLSDNGFELYSPLAWQEQTVKQNYQELLVSYVPMLRFLGSQNFYHFIYPEGHYLTQKVLDNMVLPLSGAEDLSISFDYYDWQPYFKTNSKDGLIQPDSIFINYEVLNFGYQRYETNYDVSYPVLVTIEDKYALNGQGYRFNFALESNIRNNEPAVAGEVIEPAPQKISSLACAEGQRNTELIKSVVVDSYTQEPVEMVRIGFTIPNLDECEMGLTNQNGEFESSYPAVYGGVINFIHPDYLLNFYPIDTYKYQDQPLLLGYAVAGTEAERVIELDRFKTINVTVKQKQLKKCLTPLECDEIDIGVYKDIDCDSAPKQCFFNSGNNLLTGDPALSFKVNQSLSYQHDYYFFDQAKPLAENQEVMVTFERVKGFHDEVLGDNYLAAVGVSGENKAEIKLVPGLYKVNAFSTMKEPLTIPTDKRCFQYDILTREEQECVDIESKTLESYVNGNLLWDTEDSYLVITADQLYSAESLTFYVLAQDLASIPTTITVDDYKVPGLIMEDLQVFGKMNELSKSNSIRTALQPQFS